MDIILLPEIKGCDTPLWCVGILGVLIGIYIGLVVWLSLE